MPLTYSFVEWLTVSWLKGACLIRLTPADRAALEALQAFTNERTATRAIGIAVQHYPDTCRALENAEADRDQARRALQQILDALDKVDNAQSSLHQVIQGLCQRNGGQVTRGRPPVP